MYVVPSSSSARRNSLAPSRVAGRLPQTPISRRTRSSPPRRATRPTWTARFSRSARAPMTTRISPVSVLETRRLHALPRQKGVDRSAMDSQHTSNSHCIETAVVDQSPNRLGMDAQLIRHVTDADEIRLSVSGRHRTPTYSRNRRIAAPSSHFEVEHFVFFFFFSF